MVWSFRRGGVTAAQVAGALLSDSSPVSEGGAAAGSMVLASRGDHKHPRLSVTAQGALDSNGQAPVTFMRDGVAVTFATKPAVTCMSVSASAAVFFDFAYTTDAQGRYIGGTLTGRKGRALPQLTAVSGILTAVITGVNALVSALTGFDPFNSAAAGVEFSFIAIGAS